MVEVQVRILGQQLGAYVYRDPRIVIADHNLAQVSGTFWTTDRSSAEGNSISDLKISLPAGEKNQTIFWGDGTSGSFTSNTSASTTTTTTGAVTETVNPGESARTRSLTPERTLNRARLMPRSRVDESKWHLGLY